MLSMRILHITAQKPDGTGSGVYLSELVNACARVGIEQAVIAGIGPEDQPAFPRGTRFVPVRFETVDVPFPVVGMSDEMPYRSTRYRDMDPYMVRRFDAAFTRAVHDAVDLIRPDVVICHHLYLLTSLVRDLLPFVPVAAVCHSTDVRQMRQHDLERDRILGAMRRLDAVFALHEAQKSTIKEVYGIEESRIHVVGTGFNRSIFNARALEKGEDGLACCPVKRGGGTAVEAVFVGKITNKKGVPSLLRALDLLPYDPDGFRLRLAGGHASESEYRAIRSLAELNRYDVEFLGKLSQADLARVYCCADVFVLPSFFEGLPLVVVEALACGCSVVVTDLPGIRPWIESHIPDAPVWYVAPPRVRDADEPVPDDLPAFEACLAEALCQAVSADVPPCSPTHLSWDALASRVISLCSKLILCCQAR